jgi:hypothetical protein
MTIIAVSGREMACDGVSSLGSLLLPMAPGETKIVRAPDGSLVGASGSGGDCQRLRNWATNGMSWEAFPRLTHRPVDQEDSIHWLWLKPDGTLWFGDAIGNVHEVSNPFSIGFSHACSFVDGALAAGANLHQAVTMACERHAFLRPPVSMLSLDA